ncbi:uncharacterized protein LOC107364410 [Tetranychus urticae]|uniref:BTB domain-containing protein n=1 Tax=Tetranychus urticae TaxID=32264 RepID=T1KJD4_TETUR|nr:uncharacterized protein LOC107364410 [Tetranychus urticae]
MESKETDQLTIVNRSRTHHISKKLIIGKIPYFQTVLSNDSFMESKENMFKLDFDEQAFQSFLTWVESDHVLIEMKNLINLCTIMDYFGINNYWMDRLVTYFHDKFSISDLPVVIPQVTPISKCINAGTLDAFICRHFLKIASTTVWLNYPIKTIGYICKLDLMVHSEMQVFNAIMKWINFNIDARKDYLEKLLTLVRYCDLDSKDLLKIKENDFVKTFNFKPTFCSHSRCTGDCEFDRSNQYYSVLVEEMHGKDLRIKVLDRSFQLLIKQVFKLDESMPLRLFPNEYVSDIVFDSGSKMIRIDWNQKKYRLIGVNEYKYYYYEIVKCIFTKHEDKCYKIDETRELHSYTGSSLLEFNDQFILISQRTDWQKNNNTEKLICWTAPSDANIEMCLRDYKRNYQTTALDNDIYILNSNRELIQFNIESQRTRRFKRRGKSHLDDLILTSMPGQDKVVLIDKLTRIVDGFNVKDEEWSTIGLLADEMNLTDDQRKSNKLLTLTSAFLRLDTVTSFSDLS